MKVVTGTITSRFGPRMHPIQKVMKMHNGVDIAATAGTPVYSPVVGKVIGRGYSTTAGNYVHILAGGKTYVFMHLQEHLVVTGSQVAKGQQIGTVGKTGLATGYHLHIEVHENGRQINPEPYIEFSVEKTVPVRTSEKLPRGLRNNNPGNIRINTDKFDGEIQPSRDTSFKQFKDITYGYRAMFVILSTYLEKYSCNTIEKIMSRWAPATENNTQRVISTIVQLSGLPANKVLTSRSGADYINIVAAISRLENGIPAVMSDVEAGLKLQNRITR